MATIEKYEATIRGNLAKSEVLTIDHATGMAQIDVVEHDTPTQTKWYGSAGAGEVTQFIAQADRKL